MERLSANAFSGRISGRHSGFPRSLRLSIEARRSASACSLCSWLKGRLSSSDLASEGAGEFEPRRVGQYQQIFPFNQRTRDIAGGLASAKDSVPVVKEVVSELRQWMKREMTALKASSSSSSS